MINDVKHPLVTIITVCYNAALELEKTINSVISQSFMNREYIIIDGGSTDSTHMVIDKYNSNIDRWISEPDKGIYDAMNKGITLANGEWVIFMNAGDLFASERVLSNVFKEKKYPNDIGLIFGDCILSFGNNKNILKSFCNRDIYKDHSSFCHQALFTRCRLAKTILFDTSYRIIADYIMVDTILNSNIKASYQNLPIAIYDMSGISSTHELLMFKEKVRYLRSPNDIKYYLKYGKMLLKKLIVDILGEKILLKIIYYKVK